jgi:hypothetical protein
VLTQLDEGWFTSKPVRQRPKPQSRIDPPSGHGLVASRPLDLSALRREQGAPVDTSTPPFLSTRSSYSNVSSTQHIPRSARSGNALLTTPRGLADGDTPRSWATAYSVASSILPQTWEELEAVPLEEVARLAEQAEELQRRAAEASRLTRRRLRELHSQDESREEAGFASGGLRGLAVLMLGVAACLLTLWELFVSVVVWGLSVGRRRQRFGWEVHRRAFAVAGAVCGVVEALLFGETR